MLKEDRTQERKDLLLSEVTERLRYGVKARVLGWDEEKEEEVHVALTIYSVNTDGYVYFEANDYDVNYIPVENVELYLRPMSSMTKEEQEKLDNILFDIEHSKQSFYAAQLRVFEFMWKHHLDLRGLTQFGLALEAPDGMYDIQ